MASGGKECSALGLHRSSAGAVEVARPGWGERASWSLQKEEGAPWVGKGKKAGALVLHFRN